MRCDHLSLSIKVNVFASCVMLYGYLERHSSFAVKHGDSLYILFPTRMQDDWQPICTQLIELHIEGLQNLTNNVYMAEITCEAP